MSLASEAVREQLKQMTRRLVQKPHDPKHPGLIEAKLYVLFPDALAALEAAYDMGKREGESAGTEQELEKKEK